MILQRLALVGNLYSCPWCAAELINSEIRHSDNCDWITDILDAQRKRIMTVLEDLGENLRGDIAAANQNIGALP